MHSQALHRSLYSASILQEDSWGPSEDEQEEAAKPSTLQIIPPPVADVPVRARNAFVLMSLNASPCRKSRLDFSTMKTRTLSQQSLQRSPSRIRSMTRRRR